MGVFMKRAFVVGMITCFAVSLGATSGRTKALKRRMTVREQQAKAVGEAGLFFAAARTGCVSCMQQLLFMVPDCLGVKDANGCTPLHIAAQKGHAPLVAFLL